MRIFPVIFFAEMNTVTNPNVKYARGEYLIYDVRKVIRVEEINDGTWKIRIRSRKRRTVILSTKYRCPCIYQPYPSQSHKSKECPMYKTGLPWCNGVCNDFLSKYPEIRAWCMERKMNISDFVLLPRWLGVIK